MALGDAAITIDMPRYEDDTANEAIDFYTDTALSTQLALTGRTFDGRVRLGSTTVFALTCTVGSAPNANRITLSPATGSWADLAAGKTYRLSVRETTSSVNRTIIVGDVPVTQR